MLGDLIDYEEMLGMRIRVYRERTGMSQKMLAEACHLSESAIRNYELGNRIPSQDILQEIADALRLSYYALAEPTLESATGVMHILFRLEYLYGLRPIEIDGQTCLAVDTHFRNYNGDDLRLQKMLDQWMEARMKLDRGEWTGKPYDRWQSQYSEESDTNADGDLKKQKRKRARKPGK